jgi:hypothetical protein
MNSSKIDVIEEFVVVITGLRQLHLLEAKYDILVLNQKQQTQHCIGVSRSFMAYVPVISPEKSYLLFNTRVH